MRLCRALVANTLHAPSVSRTIWRGFGAIPISAEVEPTPKKRPGRKKSKKNAVDEFDQKLVNTSFDQQMKDLSKLDQPTSLTGKKVKASSVVVDIIKSSNTMEIEHYLSQVKLASLPMTTCSAALLYLAELEGTVSSPKVSELIDCTLALCMEDTASADTETAIKTLGLLCLHKGWELKQEQAEKIMEIAPKMRVTLDTIFETIQALAQCLGIGGHNQIFKVTMLRFLQASGEEVLFQTKFASAEEISQMLYFLHLAEYQNPVLLDSLIGQLMQKELNPEAAIHSVMVLDAMNYPKSKAYLELLEPILPYLDQIPVNHLVTILAISLKHNLSSLPLSKFFSAIHLRIEDISIDAYLQMLQMVSDLIANKDLGHKLLEGKATQSMKILKKYFGGSTWGLSDLETTEMLTILECLVQIKDNDVAFSHNFISQIFKREVMETCDGPTLVRIFKILFSYSKFYEDAFIDGHAILVKRMDVIPDEHRKTVIDIVRLKIDILPKSPFLNLR